MRQNNGMTEGQTLNFGNQCGDKVRDTNTNQINSK